MPMPEYSDEELVDIFRNEARQDFVFNIIVNRYKERLYWHIRKIVISHEDTDDVLQNAFIKAWKGLANFRNESKLYTWLYRIATNESITFLKKQKRKFFLPIIDVQRQLENKLEADEHFTGDEVQLKLQKAILSLPEKQRLVFNMKYFDEMKYNDIAEILETSVGALKASYHHAVKKIENFIKAD